MYRNKALQKETTKDRVRRYRDKQKALQGVTLDEGVTDIIPITLAVSPVTSTIVDQVKKLPNCPDGRWRPYSKEDQLSMKPKKQANKELRFAQLKKQYGVNLGATSKAL